MQIPYFHLSATAMHTASKAPYFAEIFASVSVASKRAGEIVAKAINQYGDEAIKIFKTEKE